MLQLRKRVLGVNEVAGGFCVVCGVGKCMLVVFTDFVVFTVFVFLLFLGRI